MDKYLISLAFILLFLECGWLAEDLGFIDLPGIHRNHAGAEHRLGEVTFTKNEVRKKTNSSLVWEETRNQQNLFAYDSVLTLNQSAAEILLNSGGRISLNENTLISIEPPDENADPSAPVRLRFQRGVLRTAGGRTPQSIGAGEWVVEAAPKTNLVIRSRGPAQFDIESHDGQAQIVDPKNKTERTLKSGEHLEIKDGQISENTAALALDWLEPKDGQRLYTHSDSADLFFEWRGDITAALIDRAEGDGHREVPADANPTGRLKVNLLQGNYGVRLKNAKAFTFARTVSVWPAPKIFLLQPLPRQRIKSNSDVSLLWSKVGALKIYRWQIAVDVEFRQIVSQGESADNFAQVKELPRGQYYWRVLGVDELGFVVPEYYSNPFTILDHPLEAPQLETPEIKQELNGDDDKTDSDDKGRRSKQDGQTSGGAGKNQGQDKLPPQKINPWYFALSSIFVSQAKADELAPTPGKDVPSPIAASPLQGVALPSALPPPASAPKHYFAEFKWQAVVGARAYVIELSTTPDFRRSLITKVVTAPRFKWKNFTFGQYYWRVAGQDAEGEQGEFSKVAHADLRTIPVGPITTNYSPVTTAARTATTASMAATAASAKPRAAPILAPGASSAPTAQQAKPKRPLKVDFHVRHYAVELGAHYVYEHFVGPDFVADSSGPYLGDLRLTAAIDGHKTPEWIGEFELARVTTKPKDPTALPFQGQSSNYSFRLSVTHESPYADDHNWGLTVLNEYPLFSRADLENLNITTPVLAGGFLEWKSIYAKSENAFRLATYLGPALVFEGTLAKTFLFSLSETATGTVRIEARGATALSMAPGWFIQGTASAFFGVRW